MYNAVYAMTVGVLLYTDTVTQNVVGVVVASVLGYISLGATTVVW